MAALRPCLHQADLSVLELRPTSTMLVSNCWTFFVHERHNAILYYTGLARPSARQIKTDSLEEPWCDAMHDLRAGKHKFSWLVSFRDIRWQKLGKLITEPLAQHPHQLELVLATTPTFTPICVHTRTFPFAANTNTDKSAWCKRGLSCIR